MDLYKNINEIDHIIEETKKCQCCERHMTNRCIRPPPHEKIYVAYACECICRQRIRKLLLKKQSLNSSEDEYDPDLKQMSSPDEDEDDPDIPDLKQMSSPDEDEDDPDMPDLKEMSSPDEDEDDPDMPDLKEMSSPDEDEDDPDMPDLKQMKAAVRKQKSVHPYIWMRDSIKSIFTPYSSSNSAN